VATTEDIRSGLRLLLMNRLRLLLWSSRLGLFLGRCRLGLLLWLGRLLSQRRLRLGKLGGALFIFLN
jgi:hypothetical protein